MVAILCSIFVRYGNIRLLYVSIVLDNRMIREAKLKDIEQITALVYSSPLFLNEKQGLDVAQEMLSAKW